MTKLDLGALIDLAREAEGPSITPPSNPVLGGVDPLGLRQVNFDMMDQVLPGINNVGRHVRPYVVTAWACRRGATLAKKVGLEEVDINDFVDRIEVLYAWSQFLKRPDADLPGRQALGHIVGAASYTFGGNAWLSLRKNRRYSTALTAPITYGPALKNLGWVGPHHSRPEVLIALPTAYPALDSFEAAMARFLDGPAFSSLEPVTVTREEVQSWADAWDLLAPTEEEQRVAAELLSGATARRERRNGVSLMLEGVRYANSSDTDVVRKTLCGAPTNFSPPDDLAQTAVAWRRLQVRQLFRFVLETFLYWIGQQLLAGPRSTDELVVAFLQAAGGADGTAAGPWLGARVQEDTGPTDQIAAIQQVLAGDEIGGLPAAIIDGIALSLAEAPTTGERFERSDRLPLFRAKKEADRLGTRPAAVFVKRVLESWVLAQHVYWSVGRGLADARARGRQILRLKVVLEEQGWELAPGTQPPAVPSPTPDRLQTALTLAVECGLTALAVAG